MFLRIRHLIKFAAFNCNAKLTQMHNLKTHVNKPMSMMVPMSNNNILKAQYCVQTVSEEDKLDQIVQDVCKGDATLENKLRVIMLELEVMRQDGRKAPENYSLKNHHWEHILSLPSRSARYKYFQYLWKIEKKTENVKAKKEVTLKALQEVRLQRQINAGIKKEPSNEMIYGLCDNSLFLRIYETSINTAYNYKLMQALQFGEKIVIDCSYDKHMNSMEASNAANQLTFSFSENRNHKDPFDLHLCNCNPESITIKQLNRNIPKLAEPWFPLHIHQESYADLFPKKNLVYLTPHCKNELTEFDPNAIYIIGCMVDKVNNDPISLAKAKEQNIKMAKFPLDRHLQWGSGGTKSLTINQVLKIMLDLKLTGDWKYALRHVPRRKVLRENITDNNDSQNKNFRKPRPTSSYNSEQRKTSTNFYKRKLSLSSLLDDDHKY